jgi:hypothetical protein
MEAIMRAFSNMNPDIKHIAFRELSENHLRELRSAMTETVAQILRWSIFGFWLLVVALPAVVSITASI